MLPLLHPSSGTGMLGMWRYEWMMTMSSISRQVRQVGHTHTHIPIHSLFLTELVNGSLPGGSLLSPLARLRLNPPSPAPDQFFWPWRTATQNRYSKLHLLHLDYLFTIFKAPIPQRNTPTSMLDSRNSRLTTSFLFHLNTGLSSQCCIWVKGFLLGRQPLVP